MGGVFINRAMRLKHLGCWKVLRPGVTFHVRQATVSKQSASLFISQFGLTCPVKKLPRQDEDLQRKAEPDQWFLG